MSTCEHNNFAPNDVLNSLHDSQAGLQRHKCTECAYRRGYELAQSGSTVAGGNAVCEETGRRVPAELIDNLPESQAGPGRHKCAVCAFHEGLSHGSGHVSS